MTSARTVVTAGLVLVAATVFTAPLRADDWPFPHEQRDELVWLHHLVNYADHPEWRRDREAALVSGGGLYVNVASVDTRVFRTLIDLNLIEPLGGAWRFLYRLDHYGGLDLDRDRSRHWLGFERRLRDGLAAQIQTHPTTDKAMMDLQAGLLLHGADRHRFLRLLLRWDDFNYTGKNDVKGEQTHGATGLVWELRLPGRRWELFGSGAYATPERRRFPDAVAEPRLSSRFRHEGGGEFRLRRLADRRIVAELGLAHHRFRARDAARAPAESFDYRNETLHVHLLGCRPLSETWHLRPELHLLRQWSASTGRRDFAHRRTDVFPALYLERRVDGRLNWEIGYLADRYQWRYREDTGALDRKRGYADKIEIAWFHTFDSGDRLQLSLSHEPSVERFGGGNVQFQAFF